MFRGKQRLMKATGKPVMTAFLASFLDKSEAKVREVAQQKNKRYTCIKAAANQGLAMKDLAIATNSALDEAMMEAASVDTTDADNRLAEEGLKAQLKTYLKTA